MTTAIDELPPPAASSDDPFRYGWRYTRRLRPDGFDETVLVPLTLEDLLHPEEGDHVTHSNNHQRRRRYLCNVFEAQLEGDPTAFVLDDVRVKWDVPNIKPHGPDIMIVRGVRQSQNWSTFDVAEEGVLPDLIVEITSPETADIDRSRKLDEYDLAGLPTYVLVDGVNGRIPSLRLLAYTRGARGNFEMVRANEQGWVWIEVVQLWLAVADNELVCYDRDGQVIRNYADVVAAMDAEQAAHAQAEQRATQAEQRATQAEQRAAEETSARAQAEQRAAQAEARLSALEAELQRLRGA